MKKEVLKKGRMVQGTFGKRIRERMRKFVILTREGKGFPSSRSETVGVEW
jgi:hypothetical protein